MRRVYRRPCVNERGAKDSHEKGYADLPVDRPVFFLLRLCRGGRSDPPDARGRFAGKNRQLSELYLSFGSPEQKRIQRRAHSLRLFRAPAYALRHHAGGALFPIHL